MARSSASTHLCQRLKEDSFDHSCDGHTILKSSLIVSFNLTLSLWVSGRLSPGELHWLFDEAMEVIFDGGSRSFLTTELIFHCVTH